MLKCLLTRLAFWIMRCGLIITVHDKVSNFNIHIIGAKNVSIASTLLKIDLKRKLVLTYLIFYRNFKWPQSTFIRDCTNSKIVSRIKVDGKAFLLKMSTTDRNTGSCINTLIFEVVFLPSLLLVP